MTDEAKPKIEKEPYTEDDFIDDLIESAGFNAADIEAAAREINRQKATEAKTLEISRALAVIADRKAAEEAVIARRAVVAPAGTHKMFALLIDMLGLTQALACGYLGLDKSAIHKKSVGLRPVYMIELDYLVAAWKAVDAGKGDEIPGPVATEKPKLTADGQEALSYMRARANSTLVFREM